MAHMTLEEKAALDHFAGIVLQYMLEELGPSAVLNGAFSDDAKGKICRKKRDEIAKASYARSTMIAARREIH
ncbi:hypothetical protein [Pseudomonas tolaasii]